MLSDLSFIAIDQGPGAFTSLRVTIATANALGFASKTPLIGIDSLDALALQIEQKTPIACLLNAYTNDVYAAAYELEKRIMEPQCKKIDVTLGELKDICGDKEIIFTGNGTELHKDSIQKVFGNKAIMGNPLELVPRVQTIALMALEQWNKQPSKATRLVPRYLKSQMFIIKK